MEKIENTLKSNILIAKFMGENVNPMGMSGYDFEDLEYHIDWDWLMGAVEKIEQTKECWLFIITTTKVSVLITIPNKTVQMPTLYENRFTLEDDKREEVYKAVVEYIKWYNTLS